MLRRGEPDVHGGLGDARLGIEEELLGDTHAAFVELALEGRPLRVEAALQAPRRYGEGVCSLRQRRSGVPLEVRSERANERRHRLCLTLHTSELIEQGCIVLATEPAKGLAGVVEHLDGTRQRNELGEAGGDRAREGSAMDDGETGDPLLEPWEALRGEPGESAERRGAEVLDTVAVEERRVRRSRRRKAKARAGLPELDVRCGRLSPDERSRKAPVGREERQPRASDEVLATWIRLELVQRMGALEPR